MNEITENIAYKVYAKFCDERFTTTYEHGEPHAELMVGEIKDFLHDLFVVNVSFDEAYAENMHHFTEQQAREVSSIYEVLFCEN